MKHLSDLSLGVDHLLFAALLRDHTEYSLASQVNYSHELIDYTNELLVMANKVALSLENIRLMPKGSISYDIALLCKYIVDRSAPVAIYGRIFFFWDDCPMTCVVIDKERQFSASINVNGFFRDLGKKYGYDIWSSQAIIFKAVRNDFLRNPRLKDHEDFRVSRILGFTVLLVEIITLCCGLLLVFFK